MSVKDMYEKDYYKILGVSKDADAATIKKAYRKLAKDLHPDTNSGDKKIEEKFKAVSEAYDVVSDAKRRAEYDEARRYGAGGPMGGARRGSGGPSGFPGGQNVNVDDLFGGGERGQGAQGKRRAATGHAENSVGEGLHAGDVSRIVAAPCVAV